MRCDPHRSRSRFHPACRHSVPEWVASCSPAMAIVLAPRRRACRSRWPRPTSSSAPLVVSSPICREIIPTGRMQSDGSTSHSSHCEYRACVFFPPLHCRPEEIDWTLLHGSWAVLRSGVFYQAWSKRPRFRHCRPVHVRCRGF